MATGDYCTLDELKRDLWPSDVVPDDVEDPVLESIITAASREIDKYTGTRFYTTTSDETRYFTTKDINKCWIDPAVSITSVATDDEVDRTYGTSWTADTHYELWPYNYSLDGVPIYRIDRVPLGDYSFPTVAKGVKVVGKFGYDDSTAPENTLNDIKRACILQCLRLFFRKDAPFGTLGPTEMGQVSIIPGLDPDVKRILEQYRFKYT